MQEHRILVIEDDVDIRQALSLFLTEEGYRVSEAGNGKQGLALLEAEPQTPPNLILLDLFMPIMNGEEFLLQLQKHAVPKIAQVPVVVISAAPPEGEMVRSIKNRAQGFLKKPVNFEKFLAYIDQYCPKDTQVLQGNTTSIV